MLQRLSRPRDGAPRRGPRALILVPTRELAVQVAESFGTYGRHLRVSRATIFGGVGQGPQVDALRRGAEVVVATPGRLLDLMDQGHVRLGAMGLGTALWKFDANVIDGAVNGAGWLTKLTGTISSWWDNKFLDRFLVNGPAVIIRGPLSWGTRLLEWGQVQFYALVMTAGVLGFIAYYVWK